MSVTSFAFRPSTRNIISIALTGLCLGLILTVPSCNEAPVGVFFAKTVMLSVDNVSCTEAWVRITPIGLDHPTVVLQRDAVPIDTLVLCGSDTMIVDSGLLPGRSYTYSAYTIPQFSLLFQTRPVQVRTMDTTSHEFTWEVTTLGDGVGSSLYDVAIINDTLAYAVGEIYLAGETDAYNAARWNGANWSLIRIPFIGPCSAVMYPPLRAIWAFSETNILVTNGGSVVRYDGTSAVMDCGMNSLLMGAINRIYGNSSQDVYAVGGAGSIVHYNGTSWTKIGSGTDLPIQDIWGATNPRDGKPLILCAVSHAVSQTPKLILRINSDNTVDTIPWPIDKNVYSLWHLGRPPVYACGSKVMVSGANWQWRQLSGGDYIWAFTEHIRGQAVNDIFVVGDFGIIAHYNGVSFRLFNQIPASDYYRSCAYRNGMMIAVGAKSGQAMITRMWR